MRKILKLEIRLPHLAYLLIIFLSVVVISFYGASIILPLLVAALIAAILNPLMEMVQRWGLPKWAALTLTMVLFVFFFIILSGFVSLQVNYIVEDWSKIQEKALQKYDILHSWLIDTMGFNPIDKLRNSDSFMGELKSIGMSFLSSFTSLLSLSVIIFIYIILMLLQKKHFINFLYKAVGDEKEETVRNIVSKAGDVTGRYLIGKIKIIAILFTLYLTGFYLGNVPYAIFLALFASVFSIIPYLGNIIGGGVAILLAYIYNGINPALIVIGVISIAQILENYILSPWIIGDEIDLNPFATIFSVIVFSALWGVVGAIIALPVTSVIKVILSHTEGGEKYAYILAQQKEKKEG